MIDLPHDLTSDDCAGHGDERAMFELTGSRHCVSGLCTPGTVMLPPAGYIRSLGEGSRRDGVAVLEISPVAKIERTGNGWTVTTPQGRVHAGKVILATTAIWKASVLRRTG